MPDSAYDGRVNFIAIEVQYCLKTQQIWRAKPSSRHPIANKRIPQPGRFLTRQDHLETTFIHMTRASDQRGASFKSYEGLDALRQHRSAQVRMRTCQPRLRRRDLYRQY